MPRVEFDPKNKKTTSNFDFAKFKLKNGERARIMLPEDPLIEYAHTLRMPTIVNGVPQMGTEKRRDGSEYQDYRKTFVGRPLCLGDFETLDADGSDPVNCPMCKMAKEHPEWAQAPQRRYAVHVVRYKTKAGSFDVTTPFSVDVSVWGFTDMVFNQISDFKSEWGDLRQRDLLIGPCTNENYQKFDINIGSKAAWMEDEQRKAHTAEAFKNNQIEDLALACGARKEMRWINADLEQVRNAWAQVAASGVVPEGTEPPAEASTSLDADLSSLLDTPAASSPQKAPQPEQAAEEKQASQDTSADLDDLLASSSGASTEKPAEEAQPVEKKTDEAPSATDFDDLLKGL